jgi:hypothetical protein
MAALMLGWMLREADFRHVAGQSQIDENAIIRKNVQTYKLNELLR